MVKAHLYTPVLKFKAAEKKALGDLTNTQKETIVPLFEFVRPPELTDKEKKAGKRPPEDTLLNVQSISFPNDIALYWGDGRMFFADFTLIHPKELRCNFAKRFCSNAIRLHLVFAPVINLSADIDELFMYILDFSKEHLQSKICVRISDFEISHIDSANMRLNDFIIKCSLRKENISLLIDLKENVSSEAYKKAVRNIQSISSVDAFDNVILAGGAFPEDMTKYSIDAEYNSHERYDWLNWSVNVAESSTRTPSFGDYTIRNPIYNEIVLKHAPSTTIKYTLRDKWRIFRGKAKEFDYYLANAYLLRNLDEFKDFGVNFSAGNKYIDEKGQYYTTYMRMKNSGKSVKGTGGTEQWLRAGINHHIAVVVDQLARLYD